MRIQHNIMAMSAYRNYTNNVNAMKKNLEKLSSGYKINRAGDDAAGLAISEKMRAQITGLETAQKNAKDGISLVQTAEGALTEVHDMLNRMVELATQSANGTYDNTTDRAQMQKEINQLREEINRIADSANFNGIQLLDGSMSTSAAGAITVGNTTNAASAQFEYQAVASGNNPLTWGNFTANGSTAPTSTTGHLKSDGGAGALGEFVVDLGALNVEANGATDAAIRITIGSAVATITAADSTTDLTASGIASQLGGLKFVVSAGGGTKLVKASAALATGDLVYSATVTDGNRVTFTLDKYMSAAGTASSTKAVSLTSPADIPAGAADAAINKNLNFTVSATKTAGGKFSGWQQVGVTEYTNSAKPGAQQFGQAVVQLDASKITDGMKITIGAGSGAKTMYIKTNASSELTDASGNAIAASQIIDVSAFATATGAAKKAAYAQAIANAFSKTNQGIEVGVDSNNNLIIAEQVTASGNSAAATAVQEAMKTADGFKGLVQFEAKVETGAATPGSKELLIDTDRIYNGNVLEFKKGTGANAEVLKFEITNDPAKVGTNTANGATYVAMGSNVGANLKTALEAAYTNASVTVSSDGSKVTVKFTDASDGSFTASDMSASLTGKKGLRLQIGDTADSFNQLDVEIKDCHTYAMGKVDADGNAIAGQSIADISIADQESAAKAVDVIKAAVNYISDVRGTLGATQNRLDHTINNLSVMTENIQDAESTIRDVDVAEEMMAYTKNNILIQSAQAMLAQANQVPQGVLQLLQ